MTAGSSVALASDDIQIKTARIEYTDNTYRLLTSYSLDFNHSLEEMLSHGIPLYFKTEIEVVRPRAFWFNEIPVSKSRTTRISYNVLTRQYSISIPGTIQRNYSTLEEALSARLVHRGSVRSLSRRRISGCGPHHAGHFTTAQTIPDKRPEQS